LNLSFYRNFSKKTQSSFYPRWYVCTTRVYVLLCCSCCSCSCGHITQNTAFLSNFTMLSAYYTIACTLAMQPCPAALPVSLARQPCPVALPGSLAWQPCPAALPGSLARQPCPAALTGSLVRQPCRQPCQQPCPAALPGSLVRQPCHSSHKFRLVLIAEFHHAMKLVAF
jgi:hypothetical protein